jgi:hypothetical protein
MEHNIILLGGTGIPDVQISQAHAFGMSVHLLFMYI